MPQSTQPTVVRARRVSLAGRHGADEPCRPVAAVPHPVPAPQLRARLPELLLVRPRQSHRTRSLYPQVNLIPPFDLLRGRARAR
jgi:hypothetical protein